MNGSSCANLINPTAEKIGYTIAYCLIFVVSLVGNCFIALTVYKTQTLRKPINYFIVNMAMSDMLNPVFLFPRNLSWWYTDSWLISGPLGQALCKLVPFVADTSVLVSLQSLVLIAVDRFGAVVFPLRSPLISSKVFPFCILATWIVAMAAFSPYLFSFKLVEYQAGQQQCLDNLPQVNEVFGDSSSFAIYFISLHVFIYILIAFLLILYSIIVIKLKLHKTPGEQSVNTDEQRAKRNNNVLKMAIAIVLVYILCWVPITVCTLLIYYARVRFSCGFSLFHSIAYFVSCANCAINPFICFIFSGNYRQGLKRLLKCVG